MASLSWGETQRKCANGKEITSCLTPAGMPRQKQTSNLVAPEVPRQKQTSNLVVPEVPRQKQTSNLIAPETPPQKQTSNLVAPETPRQKQTLNLVAPEVPRQKQTSNLVAPEVPRQRQTSNLVAPEMPRQKQAASAQTGDPSIESTHIPASPLCFNDTPLKLEQLIKDYPPHCVIKCTNVPGSGKQAFKSNLDITQPLLAYTTRVVRKVSAYSLRFDHKQHQFIPIGNGILIPEDYPGWFAVMGAPDSEINHQSVSYYSKLSLLATTKCSRFLIGGKDPIRGVMMQKDEKGRIMTTPCSLLPGTVLRKAGLYRQDIQATKDKHKKRKGKDVPPRDFLKCFDEHDREMFVPTRQTGTFYIVTKDETAMAPRILQMKDILRYNKMPLIVKLIYGRVPTTPCAFTQVLLLTDHGLSRTIVASTLTSYRNINLEIPMGTGLKFLVARNTPELLGSKAYIRALALCKEQAPSYIRDMKVVFGSSQLEPDEVTRFPKTHQPETEIPSSQSLPDGTLPGPTVMPSRHEPPALCSVSNRSRLSTLSQMSNCLVTGDSTFIFTDHSNSSQTKSADKDSTPLSLDTHGRMSPNTAYNPPQRHVITGNPIAGQHSLQPASEAHAHIYDNNTQACHQNPHQNTENTPAKLDSTHSLPHSFSRGVSPGRGTAEDSSDVYGTLWVGKRTSTIDIPSIGGRPVSPGKAPVDGVRPFDYILMQPRSTASAPKSHLRPTSQPKTASSSIPPAPHIPPRVVRNHSETSSFNDSDSFTSLSEDSGSLSDWTTDEECIYINITELKRVENTISELEADHDQQLTQSEVGCPPYVELDDAQVSKGQFLQIPPYTQVNSSTEINGYLEPLHVYYQKDTEEETGEHITDPGYSTPDRHSDSGVFDEGSGYSQVKESQVKESQFKESQFKESQDTSNREPRSNNGPQLPPRPPLPQRMTLGQAVLRSVPASSKFTFTQFNKDLLLVELRRSGIKPHTEMALVGLELADISNLLSKDDNFDDDLFALLPQIGQIDLKKIAKCLREMKFRK